MSQAELSITEMEKRSCFQSGLRFGTESKIREESTLLVNETIEVVANFELAHYTAKPPVSQRAKKANQ